MILRENIMAEDCSHLDQIKHAKPKTKGCEECLKMGDGWVHLRLCLSCGTWAAATPPDKHATTFVYPVHRLDWRSEIR